MYAKTKIITVITAIALVSGPFQVAQAEVSLTSLDYYTGGSGADQNHAAMQVCAAKNGAKLTIVSVPGDQLISKVLQQGSSKTLPDILMLDNPDVADIARTGSLVPLSKFGLSASGYAPGIIAASTYKGELYSLQPGTNTISLYYNVDILAKAGVTPPKTWAELKTAARKLTKGSQKGIAFSAKADYEGTWQFLPFFWTAGGNEGKINSPQTVAAIQLWVDLFKAGSISKAALTWSQADVNNQFMAGKAAMMVNGPWQFPALKAQTNLNWKVAPIPSYKPGVPSASPLGGEGWTLPNTGNEANQMVAAKIIGCLNTDEVVLPYAVANGYIPSKMSLEKDFLKLSPDMAGFVTQVKTARARTGLLGADWPAAATKIYKAFQYAIAGGKTATEAAKLADQG